MQTYTVQMFGEVLRAKLVRLGKSSLDFKEKFRAAVVMLRMLDVEPTITGIDPEASAETLHTQLAQLVAKYLTDLQADATGTRYMIVDVNVQVFKNNFN